jgi:hypothetical protein
LPRRPTAVPSNQPAYAVRRRAFGVAVSPSNPSGPVLPEFPLCPVCEARIKIGQFLRVRADGRFEHVECPPLAPAAGE